MKTQLIISLTLTIPLFFSACGSTHSNRQDQYAYSDMNQEKRAWRHPGLPPESQPLYLDKCEGYHHKHMYHEDHMNHNETDMNTKR